MELFSSIRFSGAVDFQCPEVSFLSMTGSVQAWFHAFVISDTGLGVSRSDMTVMFSAIFSQLMACPILSSEINDHEIMRSSFGETGPTVETSAIVVIFFGNQRFLLISLGTGTRLGHLLFEDIMLFPEKATIFLRFPLSTLQS